MLTKISQRLDDPNTGSKCYWSLLRTLLNGKKIPCIPCIPLPICGKIFERLLYNEMLNFS